MTTKSIAWKRPRKTLMLGPSLDSLGGISSVVNVYRESGLFEAENVLYISTYDDESAYSKVRTFGSSIYSVIKELIFSNVLLVHIHSASRKSFYRKAILATIVRFANKPTIFHVHSGEFADFYTNECGVLSRYIVRLTLRRSRKVIALTDFWNRQLSGLIGLDDNVVTISNPIVIPGHTETSDKAPDDAFEILYLGGITQKKGIFDLLGAIKILKNRGLDISVTCGGIGDASKFNERRAALGLEQITKHAGWLSGADKLAALRRACVLVLPSYFEGQPMVILEAMANRVPIIASNVGGIPETVSDGSEAILFDAGDVENLAEAIGNLYADAGARESLAEAAYQRACSNYSADRVVAKLSTLYDEVNNEASTKRGY